MQKLFQFARAYINIKKGTGFSNQGSIELRSLYKVALYVLKKENFFERHCKTKFAYNNILKNMQPKKLFWPRLAV